MTQVRIKKVKADGPLELWSSLKLLPSPAKNFLITVAMWLSFGKCLLTCNQELIIKMFCLDLIYMPCDGFQPELLLYKSNKLDLAKNQRP